MTLRGHIHPGRIVDNQFSLVQHHSSLLPTVFISTVDHECAPSSFPFSSVTLQAQAGCSLLWEEDCIGSESNSLWFLPECCQKRPTRRLSNFSRSTSGLHSSFLCIVQSATGLVSYSLRLYCLFTFLKMMSLGKIF